MRRKCNRFQMGFKRGMKAGRHLLVLANQIKLRCANNFFPFVIATGMSIAVVHGRDSSVVGQLTSLTGQTIMSETALAGALLNVRQPLELDLKLSEPRISSNIHIARTIQRLIDIDLPDSADRERSSGALFLKKHIKLHSSSSNWLTDAAYLNHGFVPSSLSPSESGWGRSVGTKVLERSNYVYSRWVQDATPKSF
ncbi:uncharacterized protein F5891DRAFT_1173358 [Suillus fuscotomentosus]|uniref:Uncharacterized protein n=1 Tax=Suillus fuscotomentosus TaxID=1912939 RepID=A0AAD4E5N5_9AGAM|nr:uncharacterized protein F5891DRAFT_1173358 [Suillus fuscotomentosus]KAG1900035.1 hypothetical protein F5891DRAFT_1173358 [Suillus fuscotomentosus]